MINLDLAVEDQAVGMAVELHDADGVAEHIAEPLHRGGLRIDRECLSEHAQVVSVARTQHYPMFAERDRPGIAIFGLVTDGEDRHCDFMSGSPALPPNEAQVQHRQSWNRGKSD